MTAALDIVDDGPEKPVRIWSTVGRRPILAVGNSNGDIPMLSYTGTPTTPSLRLLVRHDDALSDRALSVRGVSVVHRQPDRQPVARAL